MELPLRGGGLKAVAKVPTAIKLEVNALMALPLKKNFFAASLISFRNPTSKQLNHSEALIKSKYCKPLF